MTTIVMLDEEANVTEVCEATSRTDVGCDYWDGAPGGRCRDGDEILVWKLADGTEYAMCRLCLAEDDSARVYASARERAADEDDDFCFFCPETGSTAHYASPFSATVIAWTCEPHEALVEAVRDGERCASFGDVDRAIFAFRKKEAEEASAR